MDLSGSRPFVGLVVLLAALLPLARSAGAQTPPPGPVAVLGQIGGALGRPAIQGNDAYVGAGPRLQVVDLSDPSTPRLLGQSAAGRFALAAVAVQGRYAYAAAGASGLRVFDVGDPTRPAEVASYAPPGAFQAIAVQANRVYLSGSGLRIIDVSDPIHPTELGAHLGAGGLAVAVAGNYLFSAAYDPTGSVVQVWYVAYPTDITRVGAFYPPDRTTASARGLAFSGASLLVAQYPGYANGTATNGGLRVVDIADPTHPTSAGFLPLPGYATDVVGIGDRAYLVAQHRDVCCGNPTESGGLHVVDLSTPAQPRELGSLLSGDLNAVAALGASPLALDASGLHVIDASTPSRPAEIGGYSAPPVPYSVLAAGTTVYALDRGSAGASLRILDASDPARMRLHASVSLGPVGGMALGDGYGYVGQPTGLRVIDVREPSAPIDLGLAPGSADAAKGKATAILARSGRYLYAGVGDGVQVYDLADPARPAVGRFVGVGDVGTDGIAVAGRALVVVQTGQRYLVLDLADPANPVDSAVSIGTPQNALPSGVAAGNRDAYVGWAYQRLMAGAFQEYVHIVDLANPRQPVVVGSYPETGRPVAVVGGVSYYLGSNGLRGWTNPACPTATAAYTPPGPAASAAGGGDVAYLAEGDLGLEALRLPTQTGRCWRVLLPIGE
jgi:hypothetical protein